MKSRFNKILVPIVLGFGFNAHATNATDQAFEVRQSTSEYYFPGGANVEAAAEAKVWMKALEICKKNEALALKLNEVEIQHNTNYSATAKAQFRCHKPGQI